MLENLFLRSLSTEDLEWARELHNDLDILAMLTDPHIVTPDEQLNWFHNLQNSKTALRLVAILDDQKIGLARIDQIDYYNRSVCIGLDIHKDFRGKGFAKPIYKKLFKYFFEDLDFHRLWLLVVSYNFRGIRIYTELGFKKEGIQRDRIFRNDQYYDYISMSILKDEYLDRYVQGCK